jgi:hypothetical protein
MIVWSFGKCAHGGCPENRRVEKKMNGMDLSLQHLLRYADGEDMLNKLLLGTNHGCITTNPNRSMLQCNGNIPVHLQPKSSKFKFTPPAGKFVLASIRDSQGVLLPHFQKPGENVNSALHCEALLKFRDAIRRNGCARPDRAQTTRGRSEEL